MQYKNINGEQDILELMTCFSYFHDSYITEIKYVSGSFVDENRVACPVNLKRDTIFLFQSQIAKYREIEICFEKTVKLNVEPQDQNHDAIIYEANVVFSDGLFYWSENADFEVGELSGIRGTWIAAEGMKWRPCELS